MQFLMILIDSDKLSIDKYGFYIKNEIYISSLLPT